jgi:tetratricopeptide (TPR) repeat protein
MRARILTLAARITEHLIGDRADADHLLAQALEADPNLYWAARSRALMHLREGADPVDALVTLAQSLRPRDRHDQRHRLRARLCLFASSLLGPRRQSDPAVQTNADELEQLGLDELGEGLLGSWWQAHRSGQDGSPAHTRNVHQAARQARNRELKSSIFIDLAAGIWSGAYLQREPPLILADLLQQAAQDPTPLTDLLSGLITSGDLPAQQRVLRAKLDGQASESDWLRAAVLAEFCESPERAAETLAQAAQHLSSTAIDWFLTRAVSSMDPTGTALPALQRCRGRAQGQFEAASLALEEASFAATAQNTDACAKAMREAYQQVNDLETALLELGRYYLLTGAFRDLMDLRGYDLHARPSTYTRRGEILESRLNSPLEAIAEYRSALREDPGDVWALRSLERVYGTNGEYHALSQLYRQWADHWEDPLPRASLLRLAARLDAFERRQPAEAVALYDEILALVPDQRNWMLEEAELCLRLGQTEKGCGLIEAFLAPLPVDDPAAALPAVDRLNHLTQPLSPPQLQELAARAPRATIATERLLVQALAEGHFDDVLRIAQERTLPQRERSSRPSPSCAGGLSRPRVDSRVAAHEPTMPPPRTCWNKPVGIPARRRPPMPSACPFARPCNTGWTPVWPLPPRPRWSSTSLRPLIAWWFAKPVSSPRPLQSSAGRRPGSSSTASPNAWSTGPWPKPSAMSSPCKKRSSGSTSPGHAARRPRNAIGSSTPSPSPIWRSTGPPMRSPCGPLSNSSNPAFFPGWWDDSPSSANLANRMRRKRWSTTWPSSFVMPPACPCGCSASASSPWPNRRHPF